MRQETRSAKESPPERKKRLLDQMDQWVHDIDEVLESESVIVKPSRP